MLGGKRDTMKRVAIIGCGFAGLNAAKTLGNKRGVEVTVFDRNNYHLFQPLLYQVATAGLSPAEIAVPVRSILASYRNITVVKAEVMGVDKEKKSVKTDIGEFAYDYLLLGCGAVTTYYGNDHWRRYADSLKSVEQALVIRRKLLNAFERAEVADGREEKARLLTFVVVGGGPTGVELAGAIGELSRFTLARDFRNIDPKLARVILVEAGERILPTYPEELSAKAARELEELGVHIWTMRQVEDIDEHGITLPGERVESSTVIWAAGIQAAGVASHLEAGSDKMGRMAVEPDLSVKNHPEIFVAGDQAAAVDDDGASLPPLAPVAMQQGRFVGRTILGDIEGRERIPFHYLNKGQLVTIGRKRAVLQIGRLKMSGFAAWILWLIVHIYYLIGFRNKLFVILQWTLSYFTYRKGARLIVDKY